MVAVPIGFSVRLGTLTVSTAREGPRTLERRNDWSLVTADRAASSDAKIPIRRAREWTARGALVGLIVGTIYVGAVAVIFGRPHCG